MVSHTVPDLDYPNSEEVWNNSGEVTIPTTDPYISISHNRLKEPRNDHLLYVR